MRKIKIILLAIASILISIWLFRFYSRDNYRPEISLVVLDEKMAKEWVPVGNRTEEKPSLPSESDLRITFISQAPHYNWDPPYNDFCEEASTLMVAGYFQRRSITDPYEADRELLAVQKFEMERFGFHQDTNAEETAIILKEHFRLPKVSVITDPTADQIRRFLAGGKVVIIPAAGWILGNPYYQEPGPLYHMIVIKGYKKDGSFITHDPGTRRGADYPYAEKVIMEAIHDWNGEEVDMSRKAIIVVG